MLETQPDFSDTFDIQASADTRPVTKILYSRKDAAFALSISTRALDTLIAHKQLATRRLGSKVMIAHTELMRFSRMDHYELTRYPSAIAQN